MIKTLRKYLLALCIFLFNGFNSLQAVSVPNHPIQSPVKTPENSDYANFCSLQHGQAPTILYTVHDQKATVKITAEANEKETDKLPVTKTSKEINNYFTLFYGKKSGNFPGHMQRQIPVCKHWFYSSSRRYITLQVIRI